LEGRNLLKNSQAPEMRLWCHSMPYIRRHQNSSSRPQRLEQHHRPVCRAPQIDQTTSRDVILFGDGTEIITGSGDDEDDVDKAEEVYDSEIEEQIKKGQADSFKTNGEQEDLVQGNSWTQGRGVDKGLFVDGYT
jgi:hypothetical protein